MDRKKPSLTIAIPAYNEEHTVGNILKALLIQDRETFELDSIVVYCDGCTDGTVDRVREIQKESSLIHAVDIAERSGKTHLLNRIFFDNKNDFLMVLDADIGLRGRHFLDSFVGAALVDEKKAMFAAHQIPLRPRNIIGRMFHASFLMWDYVRLGISDMDNVENFYGAATIYRKQFAAKLSIPEEIKGMRTFLYLMAKKNGGFGYVSEAAITYWPPHTAVDFFRLRHRVYGSEQTALKKIFGDSVENVHNISSKDRIMGRLKFVRDYPAYALPALILNALLVIMTKLTQRSRVTSSSFWSISSSTKKSVISDKFSLLNKTVRVIFSNYDDIKNPYYGGGGALAIHEVAKRLVEKFHVTVLTGNYPSAMKEEVIDGVRYERIGFSFVGPRLGQFFFHVSLLWQIMKRPFDVWIESFTPPISTSFLQLFTSKPVIGLVHMLSGKDMRRKYLLPFDRIEKIGVNKYKQFIVLSEASRKDIIATNRYASVEVIPNGVDAEALYSPKKTVEYILFLGRIEVDQKGLDLLLEAYAIAGKANALPLVIAGLGTKNEMKKLDQLIEKLNLGKRVRLLGKISGDAAKKQLFQKALFCVVPSRFETFSIVALEALASGTPLLAFDIDGLRWISSDAVVKVPPFKSELLAQKMIDLCGNVDMCDRLSRRGRNFVKQYDWSIAAKKYESVISSVTS